VSTLCTHFAVICEGELLHAGGPDESVAKLEGRVFAKSISKGEVENYRSSHSLLSTQLKSGRLFIRVLSDTPPGDGFVQIAPNLEDVYFSAIAARMDVEAL
jgi:hypothetical protein